MEVHSATFFDILTCHCYKTQCVPFAGFILHDAVTPLSYDYILLQPNRANSILRS